MPQSCPPTTTHVPSTNNNNTFKNQILKEVCLAHNVGGSNAGCPRPCGWLTLRYGVARDKGTSVCRIE